MDATQISHYLGPKTVHLCGLLVELWPEVTDILSAKKQREWLDSIRRLDEGSPGTFIAVTYVHHSLDCIRHRGSEAGLLLADSITRVGRSAGVAAAQALMVASSKAAVQIGSLGAFSHWLEVFEQLAEQSPESVGLVADRTTTLLDDLDIDGFEAWVLGGLQTTSGVEGHKRFFSLTDPRARSLLRQKADENIFTEHERRLRAYLIALFGNRPSIRAVGSCGNEPAPRRTSFGDDLVQVPESFRSVLGGKAVDLYRAALAHIAAHHAFTPARFSVGSLKPLQVSLVSLIEDARVEHLSMRVLPGLRRLWLPFHCAQASGMPSVPAMMARLARALIDADYCDDDAWVTKGRTLFYSARGDWHNPAISRQIGNLLGNDLGQMRMQFNSRTYVVEPPYRDDNLGLWEDQEQPETEAKAMPEIMDLEPSEGKSQDSVDPQEEAAAAVMRYPEWDYRLGRERNDWVTIVDFPARLGNADLISLILQRHAETVNRIRALVSSAQTSKPTRLRRQPEGDCLDLDACITAAIALRCHETPDTRVYMNSIQRHRDLSVLVLLDASQSTNDAVLGGGNSVISLEREATALLAEAMSCLGDPFAIRAFCSNTRDEVRYLRIKDFHSEYDQEAQAKLAGLTGRLSTRMGAAMRHAGWELTSCRSQRRLLLVVTDGEPSDIDAPDSRYLVEDSRKAVQLLAFRGIDVFCIGLDPGGDKYLTRIFGRRNVIQIDRLERLPEKLPMLYLRLFT
jgi:hypothetical protein